jgi:glutathione S-transferase
MSRVRIVQWMLEEIGQPYRTKLLEYDTTMKVAAYLAINADGESAGHPAWRCRGH